MNCVIPGANMKIIAKAIQALSKIGDEVYMVAKKDALHFQSVNMTTTVYCIYEFFEAFFSSYQVQEVDTETEHMQDIVCKIPMKAILGVFKLHGHKDKKPEFCKIDLEYNDTKIVFKLKYKHDVMVVRSLFLNEGQIVHVNYNKNAMLNEIGAPSQLFSQVLSNFQSTDDDIGVEVTSTKARMRNYISGDTHLMKGIRSQITLTIGEFVTFKVEQDTTVTFSLRPFRAGIQFAEMFNFNVLMRFDTPGKPAVLTIKNPTFEANFVIATLRNDDSTQSSLSSALIRNKSVHSKANMTVQDQGALDSVNWENEFDTELDSISRKKQKHDHKGSKPEININSENVPVHKMNDNNTKGTEDEDVISNSPENRPRRSLFKRVYETTFHPDSMQFGNVLAPDSDPED